MPSLRALAVPVAALVAATACSLLAPSDADLMGGAAQSGTPGDGVTPAEDGEGGREATGAPSGGPPAGGEPSGGALDDGPAGAGGEAAFASGFAGAGGSDGFSGLIPQDRLVLWLMADRGIGPAGGERVAVWADFSPNEADAYQSLDGLQPTVVPAAGGVPAMIEFDGENDQLALRPGVSEFSDFSHGLSAFIIASEVDDRRCPSLLQLSNGPEEQDIEIGRDDGTIHYEVDLADTFGTPDAFGLNQRLLVGVVHAPNELPEVRLNGVFMGMGTEASRALPEVVPRLNNFIGRSLYSECELFHGRIGEIILYARAVDEAEREAIQRYLQDKWSYEPPFTSKPGPGQKSD